VKKKREQEIRGFSEGDRASSWKTIELQSTVMTEKTMAKKMTKKMTMMKMKMKMRMKMKRLKRRLHQSLKELCSSAMVLSFQ